MPTSLYISLMISQENGFSSRKNSDFDEEKRILIPLIGIENWATNFEGTQNA
jgi:hypothetical protein